MLHKKLDHSISILLKHVLILLQHPAFFCFKSPQHCSNSVTLPGHCFRSSHRCSLWFRSGFWLGPFKTLIFFLVEPDLLIWMEALGRCCPDRWKSSLALSVQWKPGGFVPNLQSTYMLRQNLSKLDFHDQNIHPSVPCSSTHMGDCFHLEFTAIMFLQSL